MGWLGWTEREAMRADVNAIEIAMEGKIDMLVSIHGKSKPKKLPVVKRWRDFAETHNAIVAKQNRRTK